MDSPAKQPKREKLIDLEGYVPRPMLGVVERILGIRAVNAGYIDNADAATPEQFILGVLDRVGASFAVREDELLQIPETGPVVIVANHPFGAVEGLILALILKRRRPDAKILANYLLSRVEPLRDMFILVNPFQSKLATDQNRTPLRQVYAHLASGAALGMFPAGEVAHLRWGHGIQESPWSKHLARIVRTGKCQVVPIHFSGHNSMLFQIAGLCHPRLRTALLAREMASMDGKRIDLRVGSPIPFARLDRFERDEDLVDHLRARTLALPFRRTATAPPRPAKGKLLPVIEPVATETLAREVEGLSGRHIVAQAGDLVAYFAKSSEIPNVLREIGRLREITFRETGEGTGKALDCDDFDTYYSQLFVWDKVNSQVVGGYRVGFTAAILAERGIRGLYIHSLIKLRSELFEKVGPAIELGRSFVRPEYQKSYAPLLLLWKGLARVAYDNPECINLLGLVSISSNYDTNTRRMMVDFLNVHHRNIELGGLVKPRNPFRDSARAMLGRIPKSADPEEMSGFIEELEGDGKGMPVLLRQYLKLGAKVLTFNVDPDFSDVLDVMIVVNLLTGDGRTIARYMGTKEYAEYVNHARPGMTPGAAEV